MTLTEWKLTGKLRWFHVYALEGKPFLKDTILQQEWKREKIEKQITTDFGPGVFASVEIEWRDVPTESDGH